MTMTEEGPRGRPAYFVGPWDLDRRLACVPEHPRDGTVVMVESVAKGRALPYHRKKLVLVLSAMRHFADALRRDGFDVDLRRAPTYVDGIAAHVAERGATAVIAMSPREWGLQEALRRAGRDDVLGVPLTLHDDGGDGGHFVLSRSAFAGWAENRETIRMADFYRWIRKRTGYLMEGDGPAGGKFSFDTENRRHARGVTPPPVKRRDPDATTRAVMERVRGWTGRWGDVDGFDWAVTREQALADLEQFFAERAEHFGRYQDAMLLDEPFMWHTLISPSLNLGLLRPAEVADRIASEWQRGRMPVASAEGLLRQVVGWREFIRGIYWLRMPELRSSNLLGATLGLPRFFWEPERTDMTCLRQSIGQVRDHGYAHHIQRLMVQGNFALLAGVRPIEVSHWFWAGFVDAYEWVELPNVHGMALYADDTFTTKPYAASGNYIAKMSDYCRGCPYDVKRRSGPGACPFNHLFWSFMDRHRARLEAHPRLRMLYRSWDALAPAERRATLEQNVAFLASLEPAPDAWSFDDDQA